MLLIRSVTFVQITINFIDVFQNNTKPNIILLEKYYIHVKTPSFFSKNRCKHKSLQQNTKRQKYQAPPSAM